MGQKVNPTGLRVGINKNWTSRWFVGKRLKENLLEDYNIRKVVKRRSYYAGLSKIEIERKGNKMTLNLYVARPGVMIGKKGSEIEKLKKLVSSMTSYDVTINVREVDKPEADAQLIAENVALQIEKRVPYRRILKKVMRLAEKAGACGVKIKCSGKLDGAEMTRSEWRQEGRVPLQTFKANIDYGFAEALTTAGVIGVKAWIFKEE
ncbi:MAG: 30S ribosomal protein S3 [Deltaproteobacteria bacterium]|nr:30S ribosomal protein S3 [Deltaproteobacteria bacterium]